jgi:asparagine synthase (glutamine-hydrolysing)
MCGISGYFSPHPVSPAEWRPRLQQSMEAMALRGPDDQGTFFGPHLGLGHRRLAIIDLDGGRQPLTDPETGATIVFNGEIYNYPELRKQLLNLGHTLRTRSDTETLLHAYLEWGPDCLEKCLGMFAFAIYTPSDGRLFLARDRLGIKPLYWSEQQQVLCFASSINALLQLLPEHPSINSDAVSHYLSTIRTNLGAQTLLHGVSLIEPGHWMQIQPSGQKQIHCYWQPPAIRPEEKPQQSIETASEKVSELMKDAVRLRRISDVPLGGFLSGGIDSTIIASIACEQSEHQYHAYNVGYKQDGFNEWPFVQEAAHHCQMNCCQIELNPRDFPSIWQQLICLNGQPLTTPNEVPIYMLAKALKQDYTVALSGEGADEVFGGYTLPYFAANDYDRAARTPQAAQKNQDFSQAIARAYGQPFLPDLPTQHLALNSWLSDAEKNIWLNPDLLPKVQERAAVRNYYESLYKRTEGLSTLDRIMQVHLRVNLEGLLLRMDSSTMAASVEARVPFTDHRLLDLAFSLPDRHRIGWRNSSARKKGRLHNVLEINQMNLIESKRVLRRAFANRIPNSILERPKMSFPVPVFEWMNSWMKPFIKETLSSSPLRNTVFNPVMIDAWINDQIPMHSAKLWPIVNLCLWHDLKGNGSSG